MKAWIAFTALVTFAGYITEVEASPGDADVSGGAAMAMDMGDSSSAAMSVPTTGATAGVTGAQAAFAALGKLVGKWEAPLSGGKTIVDTFQPFAFGTAILAEEWVGGEQVTSTVFYLVGNELWADHYCDYKNQPRYVARSFPDPTVIDLEFRDATNLDQHPVHFHSTTWHLLDGGHLVQDWRVAGSPKGASTVHLEFLRKE
jgi:hypothetical protein